MSNELKASRFRVNSDVGFVLLPTLPTKSLNGSAGA
jgi:hypothetical protein